MSDPLQTWIAGHAIHLLFRPLLDDLARDVVTDWASDYCVGSFQKVFGGRREWREAVGRAAKEFLQIFEENLIGAGAIRSECEKFTPDLAKFLRAKDVAEILGSVLTSGSDTVSGHDLSRKWVSTGLRKLPAKFDWDHLARVYAHRAQLVVRDIPEIRALLDSANLQKIAEHTRASSKVTREFDSARYAQSLRSRYEFLKLESIDTSGSYYRELALWRVFIPQHVRECQQFLPQVLELPKHLQQRMRERKEIDPEPTAKELEEMRKSYFSQRPRDVLELTSETDLKRLVILGDPGAGKSSLLQALALNWANLEQRERAERPVPFIVELLRFASDRQTSGTGFDFLSYFGGADGGYYRMDRGTLEQLLLGGDACFYFDGLDEVFDPSLRKNITDAIVRFANEFPKSQVILTSRVIGYLGDVFRQAEFRHYMLQDLDRFQIEEFLRKWHLDTYAEVEAATRDEKRHRLRLAIRESRAIRELAGNPLLLTMMAILNRYRDLPRDRADLYAECSKLLLRQWKVDEALRADVTLKNDANALGHREKETILRLVARHMQERFEEEGNVIQTEELEGLIERAIKGLVQSSPRAVARALLWQLRGRNFVLCAVGPRHFSFVHRTFMEYFCAASYVWQFEKEKKWTFEQLYQHTFEKRLYDSRWREVLRLIAAQLQSRFAGKIVENLYKRNAARGRLEHLFLAGACFADIRNRDGLSEVSNTLLSRLEAIIVADEEKRKKKNSFRDDIRVHELRGYYKAENGVVRVDDADHRSIESNRAAVVRLIASGWPSVLKTRKWLERQIVENWDASIATTAVQELARGWQDDDSVRVWLMARVADHQISAVREIAVEELAYCWKEHPDIKLWLMTRGAEDSSYDVRMASARELAKGWRDDKELIPWLKSRAPYYGGAMLVYEAIQEVATQWRTEAGTPGWLLKLSQEDEWVVKHTAIQELMRGWENDQYVMKKLGPLVPPAFRNNPQAIALRDPLFPGYFV